MEKLTLRQFQIFEYIYHSSNYVTANTLSSVLGVSVRTIKSEIASINHSIEKAGCRIESKNGKGYLLFMDDHYNKEYIQEIFPKLNNHQNSNIPNTYSERVIYTIKKLLVIDYHIKLEDLADELYISRPMMTQIMKEIRSRLTKYRLKVVARPNYGIFIEGSEIDKRLAIAEYFFHENFDNEYQLEVTHMFSSENARAEYDEIFEIIRKISSQFKIEMSDFSIHNLVIHILVLIQRCKFYNYVKVNENVITQWQNTIELKAALQITREIENICHFLIPIGDSIYIAQHLRSKRVIANNQLTTNQENELHKCLYVIMEEINNNFGLNLTENSDWYHYMVLHIPQMIERLKTHMTIRNPLVNDNMRRYLFATKITHSACEIIEQFYQVEIDINEFGYLLLYFNLEVTRFELNKPIKIALLSGRGRPEAVMIAYEIKERFSSHKYQIQEVKKIEPNQFDLAISTYKVDENMDCPLITINSDNYLEVIQKKLNELRYQKLDLDIFCKEEYCTFNLEGSTKQEVIHNFYKELKRKKLIKEIPDKYNEFLDDELGNGIVHFQDSYRIVKKSMLYVCTLAKPIYWDKENVRIFILIKTKKEYDKDLYNICRVVSKWANDTQKVNQFLKNQKFEDLLEDLREKL